MADSDIPQTLHPAEKQNYKRLEGLPCFELTALAEEEKITPNITLRVLIQDTAPVIGFTGMELLL